jgi:hypothetical protein
VRATGPTPTRELHGGVSAERVAGCALLGVGALILALMPVQFWLERRRWANVAAA